MERFFKKINETTGKLPFAGNAATQRLVVEHFLDEPNLERRKRRMPATIAFTVVMAAAHAFQAGIGIQAMRGIHEDYVQTGEINQEQWSEQLKFAFAFVYALANVLVTCSQLYLTYHLFSSTDRLKKRKADAFFRELGLDPESGKAPNLETMAQYIVDARHDPHKQDVLINAIGKEKVDELLQAAEKTDDLNPFVISRAEAENRLAQIFEGTCLIKPLDEPETDYHKPVTTKELVSLFVTMAGQAAIIAIK